MAFYSFWKRKRKNSSTASRTWRVSAYEVCPGGKAEPFSGIPIICPVLSGKTRASNARTQICKACNQVLVYRPCQATVHFYVVCLHSILYGAVYIELKVYLKMPIAAFAIYGIIWNVELKRNRECLHVQNVMLLLS